MLLEGLIASGVYRPGPVPYRRPLLINQQGVAYFHQYLPIDHLLSLEPPTEAAVVRAGEEISRGWRLLPVVVLLPAEGAGCVVAGAAIVEATRRQGFDVARCWVRLGCRLDVESSRCSAKRDHAGVQASGESVVEGKRMR